MHISLQIPYINTYIHIDIYPNYADNKPKSFNFTRIYMFAILEKARRWSGIWPFHVIQLVLEAELPLVGHNLLYKPGLKEA
jgi:hypothetical protein